MSAEDLNQKDALIDKLILDIKTFVLLSESHEVLSQAISEKILGSHDEDVNRFISLIQPRVKRRGGIGSFLIAIGELVLAALLSIVGLSLMAPAIMGFQSPSQLLSYFRDLTSSISESSLSNPVIPFLDFLFSLVLLLGAFYILRRASVDMKDADLISEQKGLGSRLL